MGWGWIPHFRCGGRLLLENSVKTSHWLWGNSTLLLLNLLPPGRPKGRPGAKFEIAL